MTFTPGKAEHTQRRRLRSGASDRWDIAVALAVTCVGSAAQAPSAGSDHAPAADEGQSCQGFVDPSYRGSDATGSAATPCACVARPLAACGSPSSWITSLPWPTAARTSTRTTNRTGKGCARLVITSRHARTSGSHRDLASCWMMTGGHNLWAPEAHSQGRHPDIRMSRQCRRQTPGRGQKSRTLRCKTAGSHGVHKMGMPPMRVERA